MASNHVIWGAAEYLDYLKLRDLNVHTAESLRRLKAKRIRHALSLFIALQSVLAVAPERARGGCMCALEGAIS